MFRCPLCQCQVPPRTPSQRIITEHRRKVYPFRPKANVVWVRQTGRKPKKEHRDDPGGQGTEIVREVMACPRCAATASPGV